MTDRTGSSVTRTEFSWSTRIRSLPGGDATGLSCCTDRRRGGLRWPKWPANTPYNTQGRNEWTCSRCMMSRPLWRGGIPAKRQAPAPFPFQRVAKAVHEFLLTLLNTTRRWPRVVVACKSSTKTKVTAMKQHHTGASGYRNYLEPCTHHS